MMIIKRQLSNETGRCTVDSSGPRQARIVGCCECGNKPSGSANAANFLSSWAAVSYSMTTAPCCSFQCVTSSGRTQTSNPLSTQQRIALDCLYIALALTSAPDRVGWLTPCPGRFTSGKQARYLLYRRLGTLQGRSGRVRKISPPPGFDPGTHWQYPKQKIMHNDSLRSSQT
jgi:hypothetical protein